MCCLTRCVDLAVRVFESEASLYADPHAPGLVARQISPIVGLVFSMIIIRIGMGITTASGSSAAMSSTTAQQATRGARSLPLQFAPHAHRPSTLGTGTEYDSNELELSPAPLDHIEEQKVSLSSRSPPQ